MPIVSPGGIVTPANSDGWDLTTDLATMATSIDSAVSAAIGAVGGIPSGMMMPFAGSITWSAPSSGTARIVQLANETWVECAGGTLAQLEYPDLYNALGGLYGTPTTDFFYVPDMSVRVPVGLASSGPYSTLGDTGGSDTHTLTIAEMPSHNHGGRTGNSVVPASRGSSVSTSDRVPLGGGHSSSENLAGSSHDHGISSQGGGGSHNNMQPYVIMQYLIKA